MDVVPDWFNFQEKICNHFISLGTIAETNVSVQGSRSKHNIDILVKSKFLGQDITWIIEAKKWNKKVNKIHVLALRTIVDEIGADKGFIISEAGFQSGAYESIKNTNIFIKTYDEFINESSNYIQDKIIKTYMKRLNLLKFRYWSHSKDVRIKYGLRDDFFEINVKYSASNLFTISKWAFESAKLNKYPIALETHVIEKKGDLIANNFQELVNWFNLNFNYLDEKIIDAEIKMIEDGNFKPNLIKWDDNENSLFSNL